MLRWVVGGDRAGPFTWPVGHFGKADGGALEAGAQDADSPSGAPRAVELAVAGAVPTAAAISAELR